MGGSIRSTGRHSLSTPTAASPSHSPAGRPIPVDGKTFSGSLSPASRPQTQSLAMRPFSAWPYLSTTSLSQASLYQSPRSMIIFSMELLVPSQAAQPHWLPLTECLWPTPCTIHCQMPPRFPKYTRHCLYLLVPLPGTSFLTTTLPPIPSGTPTSKVTSLEASPNSPEAQSQLWFLPVSQQ